MHVHYLSSWYPTKRYPYSGIFVKDQITATRCEFPGLRTSFFGWGHEDLTLLLRRPIHSLRALSKLLPSSQSLYENIPFDSISELHALYCKPLASREFLQTLMRRSFKSALRATQEIGPIDLIHAHTGYPAGVMACYLSESLGIPFLITEHMSPFPLPSLRQKDGKPLNSMLHAYSKAEAVVTVSSSHQLIMQNILRRPVLRIPNAIDIRRFSVSSSTSCQTKQTVFLTLCCMEHRKGIETLLKAIKINGDTSSKFVLAGEGPQLNHFKSIAHKLNISHLVEWRQSVCPENVPALFHECDAFILPSQQESFGVVIVEAMASGKPVIATKCGGPEDIVVPDTGLLVSPSDPHQLSDAIRHISNNLSVYDIQRIQSHAIPFAYPSVGFQYSKLYKTLV